MTASEHCLIGIEKAHDALSDVLEDPEAPDSDLRGAAINMCLALNGLHEYIRQNGGMPTNEIAMRHKSLLYHHL